MARLQLNKTSLARKSAALENYERFLPSLDLRRKQLVAERVKALREHKDYARQIETLRAGVGRDLPMLANRQIGLEDLTRVQAVEIGRENVAGVELPALKAIDIRKRSYARFAKPHWVDGTAAALARMLDLKIRAEVARARLDALDAALKRVTQRVNLFEKILIPRTRDDIRRIKIYLSDAEMAAIVRSKIAKRKRAAGARP